MNLFDGFSHADDCMRVVSANIRLCRHKALNSTLLIGKYKIVAIRRQFLHSWSQKDRTYLREVRLVNFLIFCIFFWTYVSFFRPPRCSDFHGAEQSLSVSPPLWCRPCQLVAPTTIIQSRLCHSPWNLGYSADTFPTCFKNWIIFVKENWIHAHCSPAGLPPRLSNQVCAVGAKHDTCANHDCLKITMPLE